MRCFIAAVGKTQRLNTSLKKLINTYTGTMKTHQNVTWRNGSAKLWKESWVGRLSPTKCPPPPKGRVEVTFSFLGNIFTMIFDLQNDSNIV